jgi:ubiquitin carboxyl-terminal hydrolase L5
MSSLGISIIPLRGGSILISHCYLGNHVTDNSSRKMDILNADLALQNDFEKWEKAKNKPKRKTPATNNRKRKKKKKKVDDEELAFHFIAYVPINGVVWRFDGLQRQPLSLGKSLQYFIES